MIKVLAVSGGVDSMVMLDLMRKKYPSDELVVATFDHGTRDSSAADADFVSQIGSALKLRVYMGNARLGAGISEEAARKKRYKFLHQIASETKGEIYTAHHLDDLVESVAINLMRGTGQRGLAVLNAPHIKRPFLDGTFGSVFDRRDILKYASENDIVFRFDPTNASDDYLRNRVRPDVFSLSRGAKMRVYELWKKQVQVTQEIDDAADSLTPEDLTYERKWFKDLDERVAMEILRAGLLKVGVSLTRPQLRDFLNAIQTYATGKQFNLPGDKMVRMGRRDFTLKIC